MGYGTTPRPPFHDWAEAEDLGDWGEDELLEMYEQRFPAVDLTAARKARRNGRLLERRLEVLAKLEKLAAQPAQATDRIDAWFDPTTAKRLMSAGCLLLQDLVQRIADRKTWWSGFEPSAQPRLGGSKRTCRPCFPRPRPAEA